MQRWPRVGLAVAFAAIDVLGGVAAGPVRPSFARAVSLAPKPTLPTLTIGVQPRRIDVGRDVTLHFKVAGKQGKLAPGALLNLTGAGLPAIGKAAHGTLTLKVHATALGTAMLSASLKGYAPATLKIPIVPGPPATVMAVKKGLSVVAPHAKPVAGKVGKDLLELYHAITTRGQFASLGLRDGTLVDLNSNTDVVVKDPLHTTLTKGELFLEVVHGDLQSHTIQAGTAIAATKGTRLDVQYNPTSKKATVIVVEGQVQVSNAGASVLVGAGQQTTVPATRPPGAPTPVDLNKALSWVKNLPNSGASVIPPVLSLPIPKVTPIALPPIAPSPTITATGTLATTTWSGVVAVSGAVRLPAGQTLTVQPGTTVVFADSASLTIDGTLNAAGSASAPIIFTSALPSPVPGIWGSIRFEGATAARSILNRVQVFYGTPTGGGNAGMVDAVSGADITISNSVFGQSNGTAIWADNVTRPTIANCTFGGNKGFAIDVQSDDLTLISGPGFGVGQQGVHARGGAATHSGTWPRLDVPEVFDASTTIPVNTTITVQPGAILQMGSGASITVDGKLNAAGTAQAPIVFTSAQPQPRPGDWQSIRFEGALAGASVFNNVWVFYGTPTGGGNAGMVDMVSGANLTMNNDVFEQSNGVAVWADNGTRPIINNCIFGGNGSAAPSTGYAVDVIADDLTQLTNLSFGPGQAGVHARGGAIQRSGAWQRPAIPYLIDGAASIASGTSISIAPGTVVTMADSASVTVDGTLKAAGLDGSPIIFTSAQAQPNPGDWQSIRFERTTSSASTLDHVWVFYGTPTGGGNAGMVDFVSGATPTIANSIFEYSAGNALWMDSGSRPTITNSVFGNNKAYAIAAPADDIAMFTGIAVAAGQPGIKVYGGAVTHGGTWQASGVPLVVSSINIPAQITLTLLPGLQVGMTSGAYIQVYGTLSAHGTAAAPIVITSAAGPGFFAPEITPGTPPRPGDWSNIYFSGSTASASVLDHVQVLYGQGTGGGSPAMIDAAGGAAITVTNSSIAFAKGIGIWADRSSTPTIVNCTFHDLVGSAISIPSADKARVHDNHVAGSLKAVDVY